MAIRRSLAAEVAQWVAQLSSPRAVDRESAVARLTVIGVRATDSLADLVADRQASDAARSGALAALSAMDSPHTFDVARRVLLDEPTDAVAREALEIVRRMSLGTGARAPVAFEQLTELALDRSARASVRVSAMGALQSHPRALIGPIIEILKDDPSPDVAGAAALALDSLSSFTIDAALTLTPRAASEAIARLALESSPAALVRAIEVARANERGCPDASGEWLLVLGQLHQALAARHSRLGLYDLRERFERAIEPLPLGFVKAAADVGDRSCLDSLAKAWQAITEAEHHWWRTQVSHAFRTIAIRERIGPHSAAAKRIAARWPAAQPLLAGLPRPPRQSPKGTKVSRPSRTRP
jgi:hypothetical protein